MGHGESCEPELCRGERASLHEFYQAPVINIVAEVADINTVFMLAVFRKLNGLFRGCVHGSTERVWEWLN